MCLEHVRNCNAIFTFQAVKELFSLLGLFTNRRQSDENQEIINSFRTKAVALFSTSIDGQSAWTTLIRSDLLISYSMNSLSFSSVHGPLLEVTLCQYILPLSHPDLFLVNC